MNYLDIVMLNDGETYSSVYDTYVVLNAVENEYGEYIATKESLLIDIEVLISTYLKVNKIKPTSPHST